MLSAFATVPSASRLWMGAHVFAMLRISIDLRISTLIHDPLCEHKRRFLFRSFLL